MTMETRLEKQLREMREQTARYETFAANCQQLLEEKDLAILKGILGKWYVGITPIENTYIDKNFFEDELFFRCHISLVGMDKLTIRQKANLEKRLLENRYNLSCNYMMGFLTTTTLSIMYKENGIQEALNNL